MEMLKRPYEISIWDSLEDKKIAIIGSNTMTSPIRAKDPIVTKNVNGMITVTFKIHTQYFDEEKEDFVENPFLALLTTERLLKLKYKNKWYDLIIKNRQESSDQKTYTYTAKSAHINELSKNGFNLEFKTELENNQGTITELAEKVMDGTDWKIGESDIIRAYQDEQLILCKCSSSLTGKEMLGTSNDSTVSFKSGEAFYAFYSDWKAFTEEEKELQVLKIDYNSIANEKDLDDWVLDGQYYDGEGILTIGTNVLIDYTAAANKVEKIKISNYRGRRLVKKQKTRYNTVLEKYVNLYNDGEVEGYTETEYLSPTFVENLIVNPKDFESTAGWYGIIDSNKEQPTIELDFYPKITSDNISNIENTAITSRLKISTTSDNQSVYNTAIRSNITKIEDITVGDKFLLCYNFEREEGNQEYNSKVDNIQFTIGSREADGTITSFFNVDTYDEELGLDRPSSTKKIFTAESNLTKELLKNLDFIVSIPNAGSYYLKDIQLFKYVKGDIIESGESYADVVLFPGDIPDSKTLEKKYFYSVSENEGITQADKYKYLSNTSEYIPVYNDKEFEKIASIEKSESNRFNLIQELCETFECWADFVVEHEENGKTTSKTIYFREYIGKNRSVGFKYGINLKSIQRTIDSDQIATKVIVKPNSNEHGENGFCTIARATENPLGGTYLLNFDYYVNQGILNKENLNNDLYVEFQDGKGFYDLMYKKSRERDQIIANRTAASTSFLEGIAMKKIAKETLDSTEQLLTDLKQQYKQYSGVSWPEIVHVEEEVDENNSTITTIKDEEIYKFVVKIKQAEKAREEATENNLKYADYTEENYEKLLKEYENQVESLGIEQLEKDFFDKYHHFIQEGTWNSEEYWDDNEYYIDALDVARTSSRPKVSYTINVIDVGVLDGYEGYEFNIGDKTYMEDTDFFGYIFYSKDGEYYKKPYREEVVITEISEHLDSPEANQIKVQNYKTQFDDLFQRITAQTQSLQYASGGYNRASAAINNDGTIDGELLQNSLLNYALSIMNPENKGVIWDKDGIRIIDRNNSNKILKLAAGALQISNDGGETWSIAINANGINAGLVTSGSINTNEIMIGNSENYSFRWDATGLNAYTQNEDSSYNYGKFVRFDQHGLYGYSKGMAFNPENLDSVKENADFGLTWDGFFLKSKHDDPNDNGYIEIDSKEDFQVFGSDGELRVKIGLIGVETEDQTTTNEAGETVIETVITDRIYGLKLYDKDGNSVVDTDSNGNISVTGTIKATSGNIGNWQIVNGNITSAQTETEYGAQGIILDATNSQIYSTQYATSLGMDGWSINNDEAIFNNITLRGALKCAVLEYGEVQAVGGILMVRPSTTIKGHKFYTENESVNYYSTNNSDIIDLTVNAPFLELEVENSLYFSSDDWVKIASEVGEEILQKDSNNDVILYSGINTNLLKCLNKGYKTKEVLSPKLDEDGNAIVDNYGQPILEKQTIKVEVVLLSLENISSSTGTSIESLKNLNLNGMGLVNLGKTGDIGISLNSSENHAMVPETSFSMFTLEERVGSNSGTWKYLQPHILLGKIPNDPIYGEIAGKYGLYADAAKITGEITATSLTIANGAKVEGLALDQAININLFIAFDPSLIGYESERIKELKEYWITPWYDFDGNITIEDEAFKMNGTDASQEVLLFSPRVNVFPDTDYTLSFEVRSGDIADENNFDIFAWYSQYSKEEIENSSGQLAEDQYDLMETLCELEKPILDWEKRSFSFKTPKQCKSLFFRFDNNTGGNRFNLFIKNLKLEKGTMATSYQISPYDPFVLALDNALNNGYVLKTDGKGKLVGSFAPNVTITPADDGEKVQIKFAGDDKHIYEASKAGLIIADNLVTKGTIIASQGILGGWEIGSRTVDDKSVYYLKDADNNIWLDSEGQQATINGSEASMILKVGNKFGVSKDGTLYATEAKITGNITATSLRVTNNGSLTGDQIQESIDGLTDDLKDTNSNITKLDSTITELKSSITNQVNTYFGIYENPNDANGVMYTPWSDENNNHEGDLYYHSETGKGFRFTPRLNSEGNATGEYYWAEMTSPEIIEMLEIIKDLQDDFDNQVTIFYGSENPKNPKNGDLWVTDEGVIKQFVQNDNISSWKTISTSNQGIIITGARMFKASVNQHEQSTYDPTYIDLTANMPNTFKNIRWYVDDKEIENNKDSKTLKIYPQNYFGEKDVCSFKVTAEDEFNNLREDVFSVYVVRDGSSTLTMILTNENHTVSATQNGEVNSNDLSSANTEVYLFEGNKDVTLEWGGDFQVVASNSQNGTTPNFSYSFNKTDKNGNQIHPILKINSINNKDINDMYVDIAAMKDGNSIITKRFTLTKVRQGQAGNSITVTSTSVTYQASTSGTTIPTGTWSPTLSDVNVQQGQYLWTKTVVTYSDNSTSETYTVARQGVDGADGALFQSPEENLLVATDPSYVEGSNGEILQKMAPYLFESHASSYVQIADDGQYRKCFQIASGAGAGLGETYLCTSIATVNPNTQYTLSFYARGNVSTLDIFGFYSDDLNHVFNENFSGESHFSRGGIELGTDWKVINYTFETPNNCKKLFFRIDNNHGSSTSKTLYLTKLKLQASNTATPYSISPYDPFFQDAARGPQGEPGTPAKGVMINGEQAFKKDAGATSFSPASIVLTPTFYGGISYGRWQYKNSSNIYTNLTSGTNHLIDTETKTLTIKPDSSYFNNTNIATFKILDSTNTYEDIFTIYKVIDGKDGAPGDDAYTIILSNENFSFQADSNGKIIGIGTNGTANQTTTCAITAYKGTSTLAITNVSISGTETNKITAIWNSFTKKITITAYKGQDLGTGGTIEVQITADGKTFTKYLTYSVVKQGAQGPQGGQGDTGTSIESIIVQYAEVVKDTKPDEETSWEYTSPATYNPNSDYYFRYEYTWSNRSTTHSDPEKWYNPKQVEYLLNRGAVLEFGQDGKVARDFSIALNWTYTDNKDLSKVDFDNLVSNDSIDHVNNNKGLVALELNNKYYIVSNSGLAVHTNILAEGTIISSNGLIGGWTINNAGLSKDAISVADSGAIGIAKAYIGPGECYPSSSDGITGEGREWNELMTNRANLAFWDLDHLGDNNWKYILNFAVDTKGKLYARNANISGKVTATGGAIGGWTISETALYTSSNTLYLGTSGISSTVAGALRSNLVFKAGANFGVSSSGVLYASDANISGIITANAGQFGNLYIKEEKLGDLSFTVLSSKNDDFRLSPDGLDVTISKIFLTVRDGGKTGSSNLYAYLAKRNDSTDEEEKYTGTFYCDEISSKFLYSKEARIDFFNYMPTFTAGANFSMSYFDDNNEEQVQSMLTIDSGSDPDVCCINVETSSFSLGINSVEQITLGNGTGIFITESMIVLNVDSSWLFISPSGASISQDLLVDGEIDGGSLISQAGLIVGKTKTNMGFIEIYGDTTTKTPYINFHYNNSSNGYTTRIIEEDPGSLTIKPKLRIKTDNKYGRVTITAGSAEINGGIYFQNSSGANQGAIRSTEDGLLTIDARNSNGNSALGTGRLLGTWYLGTASTLVSSDFNVKNSIEKLSERYSILFDNLQPIRYKYNNGTSDRYHSGFIAQQVEEAINLASLTNQEFAGFARTLETETDPVTGEEVQVERCYLRYEEFIALNTNEIQKLKKRVAELEAQLARLTAAT